MQGGPGVFKGDLHYYTSDGDVRARVAEIDTRACPLYLLTGEYDYSCTPADTRDLAARIQGAQVTIMQGLGHFPMSEDPDSGSSTTCGPCCRACTIVRREPERPNGPGSRSRRATVVLGGSAELGAWAQGR